MLFEDGAKNPSKGISMKFLVLAYDAQSWVGAGSKEDGAAATACATDPTTVETIVCTCGEMPGVRQWIKPVMWCKSYVQCSLP